MSLQPTLDTGVPTETAAIAHAAFPRGYAYLSLRDALGPIYADAQFADLSARDGQPAACPWRRALVTVLQFAEKTCQIAGPPMPCVPASTGRTCSDSP